MKITLKPNTGKNLVTAFQIEDVILIIVIFGLMLLYSNVVVTICATNVHKSYTSSIQITTTNFKIELFSHGEQQIFEMILLGKTHPHRNTASINPHITIFKWHLQLKIPDEIVFFVWF